MSVPKWGRGGGGGVSGLQILSHKRGRGDSKFLIFKRIGGGGVSYFYILGMDPQFLSDIICEQPLPSPPIVQSISSPAAIRAFATFWLDLLWMAWALSENAD